MNKKKEIGNIFIGLVLTILSAYSISKNLIIGWIGTIFFGSGTILFIIKFFRPDFKLVDFTSPGSKEFEEQNKRKFIDIFNDNGIFEFNDTSFSIKKPAGNQTYNWTEIKSMIGYKEDLYSTDCICLDVLFDNGTSFRITEETSGWFRFLEHSKKALLKIDKDWEIEISTPAFEKNLTLVYDKQNRNLNEVLNEHWSLSSI